MVDVGLPFNEVDVVDVAEAVAVGLPLRVEFLGEALLGEGEVVNVEFLSPFQDLFVSGVLVNVDFL